MDNRHYVWRGRGRGAGAGCGRRSAGRQTGPARQASDGCGPDATARLTECSAIRAQVVVQLCGCRRRTRSGLRKRILNATLGRRRFQVPPPAAPSASPSSSPSSSSSVAAPYSVHLCAPLPSGGQRQSAPLSPAILPGGKLFVAQLSSPLARTCGRRSAMPAELVSGDGRRAGAAAAPKDRPVVFLHRPSGRPTSATNRPGNGKSCLYVCCEWCARATAR
jgi:hypothetical protein